MRITQHPDDATLISYASGALPEAASAVVAVHLNWCERCRGEVRQLARIGGALLESAAPAKGVPATPSIGLMNVRELRAKVSSLSSGSNAEGRLPPALERLVGPSLESIEWKWMAPGVKQCELPLSTGAGGYLSLLKIAPGRSIPEHGHGDTELTLVLRGAFRDELGLYSAGDVADVDGSVEHKPMVVGDEPCICLVASEQRPIFKGVVSRVLQRLMT